MWWLNHIRKIQLDIRDGPTIGIRYLCIMDIQIVRQIAKGLHRQKRSNKSIIDNRSLAERIVNLVNVIQSQISLIIVFVAVTKLINIRIIKSILLKVSINNGPKDVNVKLSSMQSIWIWTSLVKYCWVELSLVRSKLYR